MGIAVPPLPIGTMGAVITKAADSGYRFDKHPSASKGLRSISQADEPHKDCREGVVNNVTCVKSWLQLASNLLIENESDGEESDSESEADSDDEDDEEEEEARHSAWVASLEPDVSVINAGNADIDLDAKAIRDIVETGDIPQFASATSHEASSAFEKAETDPWKDL
ncbi:hypothetical protein BKA70DRAFT_1503953 [Coprinopsis sp. MPI-PUGE-AT-0042]|nr:hypothetical protein BKA70DRAFT_1503953 [Coprinopsis sp. MPI-PUGE-AT-0042]